MLLYLATAPLLPPCLKIAVNYKCSLNVSSDPEMQVGVRRRDSASPSLKRRDMISLLLYRASVFPLCFHPLACFFVFTIHLPSNSSCLSFWCSSTVLSLHLWCSLTPLWHFSGTVGVSKATGIGDSALSLHHTRELQQDIGDHVKPLQSADRMCVTPSLCVSLQLPLLVQPQEWDVEREGMWRCAR